MPDMHRAEYIPTIVVGGGQAGLAVGHYLRRYELPFVILDASERIGDAWRNRWDSLRLFSPAAFNGLAGMRFPASGHVLITKDQMADYLESYARHFALPVRNGMRVDRLWREGERFRLRAGGRLFESDNVIVAMANYQQPITPAFADRLATDIRQLHSFEYRNPSQLQTGDVLVVGAGNSGAEIAFEVARGHRTLLSGRDVGAVPIRMDGPLARLGMARLVFRGVFHRLLTVDTPMGRRARAKSHRATPLIRVKPRDLAAAGIERLPRTVGARDGLPLLEDGRTLEVRNVIWCTGYSPNFAWIDLPVFGEHEPLHERGFVPSQPGLYFVGLHFQYAMSSSMVHGVSRDAERVVKAIAALRVDLDHREHAAGLDPVVLNVGQDVAVEQPRARIV
jgi:putative flavoprotein involved in K+ transport